MPKKPQVDKPRKKGAAENDLATDDAENTVQSCSSNCIVDEVKDVVDDEKSDEDDEDISLSTPREDVSLSTQKRKHDIFSFNDDDSAPEEKEEMLKKNLIEKCR